MTTCASIRGKNFPGERCTAKAKTGEWCGKHSGTQVRFIGPGPEPGPEGPETIQHIKSPRRSDMSVSDATTKIRRCMLRWIVQRAGPLLWYRDLANNPFDFFSGDPIGEIAMRDIVSFVAEGKGYVMDIKSATSLLEHAAKNNEVATNPFNRNPLPPLFVRRIGRHCNKSKSKSKSWVTLQPLTELQKLTMATTDMFRAIEDLGYYTDPAWFMELSRIQLQRFYIELADIWFHRAALSSQDRQRIGPTRPFTVPVSTSLLMQQKALRPLLLATCKGLVTGAAARSDRQLGVMFVLGALSLIAPGAASAYPWLVDQFSPGVVRIVGNELQILHQSVLGY